MKNIFFTLTIISLIFSSCKKETDKVYNIEYSIGCTDCEVIYTSDTEGNQLTELNQNSTWNYSFNAKPGQEVLLLAYNTSSNPQGVTATIKLNGVVSKTRTTYCPISGVSFCADTVR